MVIENKVKIGSSTYEVKLEKILMMVVLILQMKQ